MEKPDFVLINFERVVPFGPVSAWASFDIEFSGGDIAREVSLVHLDGAFELHRSPPELAMSSGLRERILQAAISEMNSRPAPYR